MDEDLKVIIDDFIEVLRSRGYLVELSEDIIMFICFKDYTLKNMVTALRFEESVKSTSSFSNDSFDYCDPEFPNNVYDRIDELKRTMIIAHYA